MRDLDRALEEIGAIREQLARGTRFRGFGPTTFAATSLVMVAAALAQSLWPSGGIEAYLMLWVSAAAFSCALIALEMVGRSRRIHTHLADEMVRSAVWVMA